MLLMKEGSQMLNKAVYVKVKSAIFLIKTKLSAFTKQSSTNPPNPVFVYISLLALVVCLLAFGFYLEQLPSNEKFCACECSPELMKSQLK